MDEVAFGRYRLRERLGRGGMGEVWSAYDMAANNRTVAIKLLPPQLAGDERFVQRFRREADAVARLNNPHVIPIHNYGEIDGRLYVDMRLVEGRDLQKVLAEGPLEPRRALRIVEQVAKALHAAHKVGLVHRDVKPSNILLDEDDFAYLIDFGIAWAADQTRLTGTGALIGSWHYMAPERMSARRDADARADVYALTCVLYECLTGSAPFPGDSMESQVAAHLTDPPPQPSTSQPNIAKQVDQVIATGMAKDPDQRYATTVELANAAREAITAPLAAPGNRTLRDDPPRETPSPAVTLVDAQPPLAPGSTIHDDPVGPTRPFATEPVWQRPAHPNHVAIPPPPAGRVPAPEPLPARLPPAHFGAPPLPPGPRQRRKLKGPLIAAIVLILAAGAAIIGFGLRWPPTGSPSSSTARPSTTIQHSTPAPPVAAAGLEGLLLSPGQINTAMNATEIAVTTSAGPTGMNDRRSQVADKVCLAMGAPPEVAVYAGGGGERPFRAQTLSEPDLKNFHHFVDQSVVLFSSAGDAGAFFAASALQWPACSNRQYTDTGDGGSDPGVTWSMGPVSNRNGTLSAVKTRADGTAFSCERALTVASNVVIDIEACSSRSSGAGVDIAHQIAAKVPS